jgi:hypothetical protein
MIQKFLSLAVMLCFVQVSIIAQTGVLRGRVMDADHNIPLADASIVISNTGYLAASEVDGTFEIPKLRSGQYTVVVSLAGYLPTEKTVEIKADRSLSGKAETAIVEFILKPTPQAIDEHPANNNQTPTPVITADIPTVTLDEAESETEGAADIANLLNANRDVFQNVSGFGWSAFRFRERGYDGGNFQTLINGIPFNDAESGLTSFNEFGGLNDVLRNRTSTVGMDPSDFAFSEIGGATNIDTRASVQRKQIRASYAISNRTYRNRVMLTASTGLMPGGWAVTLSGSRRWAQEGYVEGTFFDGWSYFLSADKKFGTKHTLNLTVFGAPTKRGRSADSYQEMLDIAGSNYYNPLWGYQNGEKRNSQTTENHQPTAILRYDWTPGRKTTLTAAAYAQKGINSFSRINRLNGINPAPDFNRRLPSSLPLPDQISVWKQLLEENKALRQMDWDLFYTANRHSNFNTILDANGVAGNTVSGNQSIFVIDKQRSDNTEAGANVFLTHQFTSRISANGGASSLWYRGANFKVLGDLLGGDFWVDRDFFSTTSAQLGRTTGDNNALIPNHIIKEGDVFGYDYDEYISRNNVWAQGQIALPRFQFFLGGEATRTSLQRHGNMQNGRFPEESLGNSEKVQFTTYGAKGGIVYKLNGRNYLYSNAYYGTRAPQMRNAFVQPNIRNKVVPNLSTSLVQSIEGGYLLRAPRFKARVTGYLTDFKDETETFFMNSQTGSIVVNRSSVVFLNSNDPSSLVDGGIVFGSGVMQGINRRHAGVEIGVEARVVPQWVFSGAANLGKYIYTSRPTALLAIDNGFTGFLDPGLIYQKNFYVARTPQRTASVSVKHENRRFWFASLSLNYADNMYYDFDRLRRTTAFVQDLSTSTPLWRTIIDQQKAPAAFTLDFFGGKSWRMSGGKYYIYFNAGVNNILNNQKIIISGRESYYNAFRNDYRTDSRFYSSELVYAFGTNYFVSVSVRI